MNDRYFPKTIKSAIANRPKNVKTLYCCPYMDTDRCPGSDEAFTCAISPLVKKIGTKSSACWIGIDISNPKHIKDIQEVFDEYELNPRYWDRSEEDQIIYKFP